MKKILLILFLLLSEICFCQVPTSTRTPTPTRTFTPTPTRKRVILIVDGIKSKSTNGLKITDTNNNEIINFGINSTLNSDFYGILTFNNSQININDNQITVTSTFHSINGSNTDLLNTINGGSSGEILFLNGTNGKSITIHDGDGNIECGTDRILNSDTDIIGFIYNGTKWQMFSFEDN